MARRRDAAGGWLSRYPVVGYLGATVLLSWTVWIGGAFLLPSGAFAVAVLLGAWGPTAAAVLVTHVTDGPAAVRDLLGQLVRWRIAPRWYLFGVLGAVAIAAVAVLAHVLLDGRPPSPAVPLSGGRGLLLLPAVFVGNLLFGGPIAEEAGWRGFAVARLQPRLGLPAAGAAVGLVWGPWHLPFFLLPAGGAIVGGLPMLPFVVLATAWSVLLAWLYDGSESLLPAVLLHAGVNTTLGTLGLARGDRQLLALVILAMYAAAAAIALRYRRGSSP